MKDGKGFRLRILDFGFGIFNNGDWDLKKIC